MPVLPHSSSRRQMSLRVPSGLRSEERRVNAKSLLGVLSLGIVKGTEITLIANGPDEEEAVEALATLLASDFDK